MPKFVVYEVQEETVTRKWMYAVEADDRDQALKIVQEGYGLSEPIDCGTIGDPAYGEQGLAIRESDAPADAADPWDEALNDMIEKFG